MIVRDEHWKALIDELAAIRAAVERLAQAPLATIVVRDHPRGELTMTIPEWRKAQQIDDGA